MQPMFLRAQAPLQRRIRKREYFFGQRMRSALLGILAVVSLPTQAAEPIRLQVIPYRVRSDELQVPPLLLPPPPLLLEPAKPRKRRPNSGRDQDWEDDLEWLMD